MEACFAQAPRGATVQVDLLTAGQDWAVRTCLRAGLVGVPVIPLMPYLQALEIRPAELVQTLGIVLCATSLTLTASLLNFGLLDGPHALLSAAAMVPSMAGMWIGQRIRARLSIEQFRVAVFTALSLTGLYTVLSRLLW